MADSWKRDISQGSRYDSSLNSCNYLFHQNKSTELRDCMRTWGWSAALRLYNTAPFLSTPRCSLAFVHSCVDSPSVSLSGVFAPFHGSREVAPIVPVSVYNALLLYLLCAPVPWCTALQTAVPLWREQALWLCSAATQLSLTAHHRGNHHDCLASLARLSLLP